jgi:hypothetical protein
MQKGQIMFTRNKKILLTAVVLAGVMSVGVVATAQARNGSPSSSDDHTPTATFSPSPSPSPSLDDGLRGDGSIDDNSLDDNGLRGDGSIDDNSSATPTPGPVAPNGLPTDADHPQGDDSIGRVDGGHGSDDGVGDDGVGDDDSGRDDSGDDSDDDSGHGGGDDSDDDSGHGGDDD